MSEFGGVPWRVSVNENPLCKSVVAIVEHSPERFLAVFADGDYAVKPEDYERIANLLAAAPDLLAALKALMAYVDPSLPHKPLLIEQSLAAIAKAEASR